MTQAYNLSQLANNLDSSGRLDATDGLVNAVPVANGGTGAANATSARSNLGLGSIATQNANSVSITGGSITGITDLAVADGGTGIRSASAARTNLGVPSTTGQDASGTWNINISGNAATATTATNVTNAGLGVGQTYVTYTVGTQRISDTTYTNNTGKPIFVFVAGSMGAITEVVVDSAQLFYNSGNNIPFYMGFVVPNGSTYRVKANAGIGLWNELR